MANIGNVFPGRTAGATLPLVGSAETDAPIAWYDRQRIGRRAFLHQLAALTKRLPQRPYALNLCQDRYLFALAFAAVGVCGQTNLLPGSRAKAVIAETIAMFADCHVVDDATVRVALEANDRGEGVEVPWLPADHPMAIVFTSGSTGRSQPHSKRWGELVAGAWLAARRFGFALGPGTTIVATVPPQHMYGLETSIMLPLILPVALDGGRPLLPDEVMTTLAAVPAPRVLITTPAHLRVIAATSVVWPSVAWPALELVISATAPLSATLAQAAEVTLGAPVMEIYGCTEAGSIASRRTTEDDAWLPYDGMVIDGGWVNAAHLADPVRLPDVVDVRADGRFVLRGREQDLVNVAGKRTSLASLNRILNDIAGVEDGVFFLPEAVDAEGTGASVTDGRVPDGRVAGERPLRLAALVVTQRSKAAIMAELAERIDPVLLPRPLLLVERLPRNEVGKLQREALLDVVRAATTRRKYADD